MPMAIQFLSSWNSLSYFLVMSTSCRMMTTLLRFAFISRLRRGPSELFKLLFLHYLEQQSGAYGSRVTCSGSLARRQILAAFLQSTTKQLIPPKWPSKFTTCVVFSCHIDPIPMFVSNKKILWAHARPIPNCMECCFPI